MAAVKHVFRMGVVGTGGLSWQGMMFSLASVSFTNMFEGWHKFGVSSDDRMGAAPDRYLG